MERGFEIQKHKILQQAQIKPQVFNGMLKRLEQFAQPFIDSLKGREQKEHAHTYIADMRLYLPKPWANDKAHRKKCGVPRNIRYQTRHDLALAMLKNSGKYLPHAWIAGDDEMGRSSRFRKDLRFWTNGIFWRFHLIAAFVTLIVRLRHTVVEASLPSNLFSEWTDGTILCRMMPTAMPSAGFSMTITLT